MVEENYAEPLIGNGYLCIQSVICVSVSQTSCREMGWYIIRGNSYYDMSMPSSILANLELLLAAKQAANQKPQVHVS